MDSITSDFSALELPNTERNIRAAQAGLFRSELISSFAGFNDLPALEPCYIARSWIEAQSVGYTEGDRDK